MDTAWRAVDPATQLREYRCGNSIQSVDFARRTTLGGAIAVLIVLLVHAATLWYLASLVFSLDHRLSERGFLCEARRTVYQRKLASTSTTLRADTTTGRGPHTQLACTTTRGADTTVTTGRGPAPSASSSEPRSAQIQTVVECPFLEKGKPDPLTQMIWYAAFY